MKITQTESLRRLYEKHHVVQDMLVPIRALSACLQTFDKHMDVYPLWLCPFRVSSEFMTKCGFKREGELVQFLSALLFLEKISFIVLH